MKYSPSTSGSSSGDDTIVTVEDCKVRVLEKKRHLLDQETRKYSQTGSKGILIILYTLIESALSSFVYSFFKSNMRFHTNVVCFHLLGVLGFLWCAAYLEML